MTVEGQLIDASGNVLGAIDCSAGTLHFMPDGSAPLPKPTYAGCDRRGTRSGGQQPDRGAALDHDRDPVPQQHRLHLPRWRGGLGRCDLPQQQQLGPGAKR